MLKKLFFTFFCLVAFGVGAQNPGHLLFHSAFEKKVFFKEEDNLARLLMADPNSTDLEKNEHSRLLDEYIMHLQGKRAKFRSELDFISMVFYKTHRRFLKQYTPLTSFGEMLKEKNYDCLSATTLYTVLLERLGVKHEVIETTYHIYMKVTTQEGEALIESTDPIYGFVTDPGEIKSRLKGFLSRDVRKKNEEYSFASKIHDPVSRTGLVGLQYYNAAIQAYNNGEFEDSINLLQKALFFRRNARMDEFGLLLVQTILDHPSLSADDKSVYVNKIAGQIDLEIALASR